MSYDYADIAGAPSNRLDYVNDAASDNAAYSDIKQGQSSGNYSYNKIGELTEDVSENMNLEWRLGDHKLSKITRTDQDSPNIEFVYNPLGVRVAKIEKPRVSGSELSNDNWKVTYYSYDANGQLMATYDSELYNGSSKTTTLEERYIYGSDRIGVNTASVTMYDGGVPPTPTKDIYDNALGNKRYELTNHLGNVLATISDRKVYNSTDNVYEPVLSTRADYYAFGMVQPGRSSGLGEQRHLFNGMESDDEVSGDGNSYTTQFRQYDPRLGRWKSLDPLMSMFPDMSPYVGFANNPVVYTDPYGLEPEGGGDDDMATIIGEDRRKGLEARGPKEIDNGDLDTEVKSSHDDRVQVFKEIDITITPSNPLPIDEMPSFDDLDENYLGSDYSAPEVYEEIGGKVYQNHKNNPKAFANSCALRMCRALNYSEAEIPYDKGKTGSGSDGKWYYYRVKDLHAYLEERYGSPDIVVRPGDSNFNSVVASNMGIIVFDVSGWSDATGHITTWDGENAGDHSYFQEDLPSGVTLIKVSIWTLE